jgi:Zn-dependent peptidase ImmA (M78 family)
MSQFALVSLLLGIVPVIMYSKKLKKESKEAKDDKKEKMDKIRKIGKDYLYSKNEEEDKDKFDK